MKITDNLIDLSIVIPVFNEALNIEPLYRELKEALDITKKHYEIIYVDDGSSDGTVDKVIKIIRADKNVHLISFTKNFGMSAALAAGFKFARGRTVVSMDGDLQHDPKDIPRFLQEVENGYDLVCGYRKNRCDKKLTKRWSSLLANKIGKKIFNLDIHDFSTTLKAYSRHAADSIVIFNGAHRFIPVLAKRKKLLFTEVIISHRPRTFGVSKFKFTTRFFKIIKDALVLKISDILLKFNLPLNFKEAKFNIRYTI